MMTNMADVKSIAPEDTYEPDCSLIDENDVPKYSASPTKMRICQSTRGPTCVYSKWIEKDNEFVKYGFRVCLYAFRKNVNRCKI